MNDQQPATKAELLESLRGMEERLAERLHDTKTRLLGAIHGYTTPSEAISTSAESPSAERIARLEARGQWALLELRIVELERRILGKQPRRGQRRPARNDALRSIRLARDLFRSAVKHRRANPPHVRLLVRRSLAV